MAELLIRVVDKAVDNPNRVNGYTCMKAGDIVSVCPDGWGWTDAEKTNPDWRIVRVPLLVSEVTALLTNGDGNPTIQLVNKRKSKIDFTSLPANIRNTLTGNRTVPIIDLTTSVTAIRSAVAVKAAPTTP